MQVPETEDDDLLRYGVWSPEAQSLALPSYRASFLFLSSVPLEVLHEFLRMRLEQKPDNPSPLSVRQLMRELKEGLKIAILHRQRTLTYIESAFSGSNDSQENFSQKIAEFDNSLLNVFKLYLLYVEQWALLQNDPFQKYFLEDEWIFICKISKEIPRSEHIAGKKFCSILITMLNTIGERLMERIEEISREVKPKDIINTKYVK